MWDGPTLIATALATDMPFLSPDVDRFTQREGSRPLPPSPWTLGLLFPIRDVTFWHALTVFCHVPGLDSTKATGKA